MVTFVTLPGIGGSSDAHWQSRWEQTDKRFKRFAPASWDKPDLADWAVAVDRAVQDARSSVVLVAHSLACLLVAHWAQRSRHAIVGAFLVSVPDPTGPKFPADAASFRGVPPKPLPFPALIVASSNDPYGTIGHSRTRAAEWKTGIVDIGALGHINVSSGLGDWQHGRQLFDAFCAGLKVN